MGAFKKNFLVATIASLGVILAAAYMLWLYKRVVFGDLINKDLLKMVDLKKYEIIILWALAIPTIFFGFYPMPLLETFNMSVDNLLFNYEQSLENNSLAKND